MNTHCPDACGSLKPKQQTYHHHWLRTILPQPIVVLIQWWLWALSISLVNNKNTNIITVLPKVIWEERVATLHGRDWTRPLQAQYPLQMNPITQYATSTWQCHMHPIRYTALAVLFPLPKRKFAPSITGDIHAQSSHCNNGKMKTAYYSAYVQTEMFNFTFAQQAIIVFGYLCSNF